MQIFTSPEQVQTWETQLQVQEPAPFCESSSSCWSPSVNWWCPKRMGFTANRNDLLINFMGERVWCAGGSAPTDSRHMGLILVLLVKSSSECWLMCLTGAAEFYISSSEILRVHSFLNYYFCIFSLFFIFFIWSFSFIVQCIITDSYRLS